MTANSESPKTIETSRDAALPRRIDRSDISDPTQDASGPRLRGDARRISTMIDAIASISETAGAQGVTRLAYTPLEREAHDLVGGWLRELGLKVRTDAAGNTIAERPGRADLRAIGTGSHLDSVPHAGRFDGIAGVVAAVEAARLFVEQDIGHEHSIRFVAFAGEEGARFGQACIGSKAVAGLWAPPALEDLRDANGVSIADAMRSVALEPQRISEARWTPEEWAGFIELHVEQGAVLETEQQAVGVVDLISGSTRFELMIQGQASHTGSTPMTLRSDALAAAAEVVLTAEQIALDPQHRGTRCTVGRLDVTPGSITTIPGEVTLAVDVRDIDSCRQRDTATEIVRRARRVCERRGVRLSARLLSDASPVVLPSWLSELTSQVCQEMHLPYRVMNSGASHDTQMVNRTIPAGLLFVPSRGGLSHVPTEWTSPDDLAVGVEALMRSLLSLDAHLTKTTR